jgi:hypothetical protein
LEFNHQAAVVGISADSRHVGLDDQGQLDFGHSALAEGQKFQKKFKKLILN